MTRVFVTNEVTINKKTKQIEGTENYKYYHPKCWSEQQRRILARSHGRSFGVSELETTDLEILHRRCNLCEIPLSRHGEPLGKG